MTLLLAWFSRRSVRPPDATDVIRTFVTTLDRLDAAATRRPAGPPEDVR